MVEANVLCHLLLFYKLIGILQLKDTRDFEERRALRAAIRKLRDTTAASSAPSQRLSATNTDQGKSRRELLLQARADDYYIYIALVQFLVTDYRTPYYRYIYLQPLLSILIDG